MQWWKNYTDTFEKMFWFFICKTISNIKQAQDVTVIKGWKHTVKIHNCFFKWFILFPSFFKRPWRPQVLRCWEFTFWFYWSQREVFKARSTQIYTQQHTQSLHNTIIRPSTQHCLWQQALCSMLEWHMGQNSCRSELFSSLRCCISVQMAVMWSDDRCHLLLWMQSMWCLCRRFLAVWVCESIVNKLAVLLLSQFLKPIKSIQNPLNTHTALSPGYI